MGAIWYATIEDVTSALDSQDTLRSAPLIGRALGAATDAIDGALHRHFYPWTGTKYVDWPNYQYAKPWRAWLDGDNEIISLTSLTSGGAAVPLASVLLEPVNAGPPYTSVEINIGTSASFHGASSYQRSIALAGTFGYGSDEDTAGTLAVAITTTTATTLTVGDSSLIGTGQLLRVDSERMIVTARNMITTAQTLQTPVGASTAEVTLAVTTGSAYAVGEVLLLDAERMRIIDIAGNNLIVKRAWNGTVLAAHTGSTIYAPRQMTVTRGVLGTTAATHLVSTAVAKHRPPDLIKDLAVALSIETGQQEGSGYSRFIEQGSKGQKRGSGLAGLWDLAYVAFGTQARTEAI